MSDAITVMADKNYGSVVIPRPEPVELRKKRVGSEAFAKVAEVSLVCKSLRFCNDEGYIS